MQDILKGIKALADENRLKILKLLLTKNLCVRGLAHQLNISESGVSQQLKILREAELVKGEKKGYFVHYRVNSKKLQMIGNYITNFGEVDIEINNCCHKDID